MATTYTVNNYQLLGEHMEAFMSDIDEYFFFFDNQYNFLYLNRAAESLLGKPKRELLGKNIWEILPIEQNSALFNILLRSADGERKIKTNFYSQMYQKWFHLSTFSTTQGISVQLCDIEKDKLTFEKLNYDQLLLETFLDNIPHIAFAASSAGTNIYLNKKWTEYTGLEWDGGIGKLWKKVIHPDDYERVTSNWFENSTDDLPFEAEYRVKNKYGEYRWHLGRSNPLKAEDGSINFWIGTVTDIHDLKETQDRLKESESFSQILIDNSPNIIIITNHLEEINTYSNKVIENVLGYSKAVLNEPISQFVRSYVHPDDQDKVNEFLGLILSNRSDETVYNIEMRLIDVHGHWHWLQTKAKVFSRTESGEVKDILYYFTDITSLKEIELKLNESIHLRNKIAEASLDLVTVLDYKSFRFTYVNRAPSNSKFSLSELVNAPLESIKLVVNPRDHKRFMDYFKKFEHATDEDMLECEYQMINSKEEWRWVCSRGKVFERDSEGQTSKVIVVTQDITPRKDMEDAARQNLIMQKLLEKKDEFMSVASHELKTPITTMKASVQILQRLIENKTDTTVLKVFVTKANEQINRLTSLINDLLDNARIQAGKVALRITKFKIREVIEECVMHHSNQHKILLRNVVDEPVEADKMRISQVLTNFITNAIKYSPMADRIIIDTERDGQFLKISVTDFGIGIPKEKVNRVFDRFFRVEDTSAEFSGLGLGLYISSEIIKRHEGEYGVNSQPGKGSTFWFKIPFKTTAITDP